MRYNIRLQVGLHKCKLYPIQQERLKLQDVDDKGKPVIKIRGRLESKTYYLKLDNCDKPIKDTSKLKEYNGSVYKSINGKPRAKFKRTTEISPQVLSYVDIKHSDDLITERLFLVDSPTLLEELEEHFKEALFIKFFSFGMGYKPYQAFIYYDELLRTIVMRMGLGSISMEIARIKGDTTTIREHEIAMDDEGVDRVSESEMFESLGVSNPVSNSETSETLEIK